MTLETLGEELHKRRQEKQISLHDIAAETRINVKFLEAMEQGKFAILPQTYVRAFLREYAEAVGMKAGDVMKMYDEALTPGESRGVQDGHSSAEPSAGSMPKPGSPFLSPGQLQRTLVLVALFAGAIVITFLLINSNSSTGSQRTAQEIPFDNVVKETEATTFKPETTQTDTVKPIPVRVDSLRLEMATSDSVWMSILIDGKKTEEYLFPPHRKRTWMAKERFSVTMGNAGGATFVLNGKEIGSLGRRGSVVRNTLITEATLNR